MRQRCSMIPLISIVALLTLTACSPEETTSKEPAIADTVVNSNTTVQQNTATVRTNGFGAFLAAQHAYRNRDLSTAVDFLEETVDYSTDDQNKELPQYIERQFFFANLYQGNIDTLIDEYADNENSKEFPVQLIQFTTAMQQEKWGQAEAALKRIPDALPWYGLLSEWLLYAKNKTIDKTKLRKSWNEHFNLGLLELISNDTAAAAKTFDYMAAQYTKSKNGSASKKSGNNVPSKVPSKVHWPVQLVLMQLATGDKQQQRLELYQQHVHKGFSTDFLNRLAAKDLTESLKSFQPQTVQQGLGMLYFSLATALHSEQTQVIAILYHQLAQYLLQGDSVKNLADLNQYILGYNLEDQQFFAQALTAYQAVADNTLFKPFAIQRQARALWQMEQRDAATKLLNDTIANNPEYTDLLQVDAADYARMQSDYLVAISLYDKILETDKDNWSVYFARGVAKHQEKTIQWDAAEQDLAKAFELAPEEPEILNYLGYSWVEQGKNLKQAEAMILKAISKRPRDGFMIDSAGWVYYQLGDYKKAVKYLRRAVELVPDDPVINAHYGDALLKIGQTRNARFQWQRSLSLEPEPELKQELEEKLGLNNKPAK